LDDLHSNILHYTTAHFSKLSSSFRHFEHNLHVWSQSDFVEKSFRMNQQKIRSLGEFWKPLDWSNLF